MFYEKFIARRFLSRDKSNFSRPLVSIATYTVALGVTVMIMSVCILRGFQNEITNKIVGFGSHITVRSYGWVDNYDEIPSTLSDSEIQRIAAIPGIKSVHPTATKGGMMKTDSQIQGVVLKGVDRHYDTAFFASNIVRGRMPRLDSPETSNEVIISQRMASRLLLDTGSKARAYFWTGDNYRARAFSVVGVYNTDLSEFDEHYIIGDLRQVQRLNGWDSTEAGGYEILVDNFNNLDRQLYEVKNATRIDLAVTSICEQQPSMFAWLNLLNSNIALILSIMAIICSVSVISAMLIMIFEKISMIGTLKTLGATNRSIRRIFSIKASVIVGKGILLGNALALTLCLLQKYFHIVSLDSESYSMTSVPVDINLWLFLAISVATAVVCTVALLLPSAYISHVDPAKTVRVE